MKVGITVRFQNSYFSGAIPQIACVLSRALAYAGHTVSLLYPKGERDWFIDVPAYQSALPQRKEWSTTEQYDMIVEVVWFLSPEERARVAKRSVFFVHHPPIFHDMESSVYPWNPSTRNFKNLASVLTYDHYSAQDIQYLEFLSGVPVKTIPYLWDSEPLDVYVRENNIPSWCDSARTVEALVPAGTPKSLSWCARIVESNFSNTSHCVLPLNILTQIRVECDPIRFTVHNGENILKSEFFKSNIVKNLLLPDISGNIIPRVRLPDLRKEKTLFIAHQRFRPIKSYLLDAMYLGIPMIHNCEMLKPLGAPYFYSLNQISEATAAWKVLCDDAEAGRGFFSAEEATQRSLTLNARFSPKTNATKVSEALHYVQASLVNPILTHSVSSPPLQTDGLVWNESIGGYKYVQSALQVSPVSIPAAPEGKALRIAFCEMWDNFQPNDNFFTYLLSWMGKSQNIRVVVDTENPNLVIFGPYSQNQERKYPGVPKVFFTGENLPPNSNPDVFLNLGFQYNTTDAYIRLPLWVLEINWFGANPDKIVNPRPIALADCLTVNKAMLAKKKKFCAFVATNPCNQNRNATFHILNQWRPVDSGGRLFCNIPGGPIPAGLGGGGGELAKVEFYKDYKYVITFENSSAPGYTTEKIFHAKVAGCIPIYWGDPFVDRDFNGDGFINANQVATANDLINLVKSVEDDEERAKAMQSVPALSDFKRRWCERTMEEVSKRIFKAVLNITLDSPDWKTAEAFCAVSQNLSPAPPRLAIRHESTRVFLTAANAKYAEAAVNALASLKQFEPDIAKIVYIWPDVSLELQALLRQHGATEIRTFPVKTTPWPDFWEPQHFAWKLWLHVDALAKATPNTSFLYVDAATVFACPFPAVWKQIEENDIYLNNDVEQTNERWCHPTFCTLLNVSDKEKQANQIWAGGMGFKAGGKYVDSVHKQALVIAETHRAVIVGEKWSPYSQTCMGHRHDQSILSLLTMRANCPRVSLADFYCDRAMRTAKQWHTPFYVHRGNYREYVPFADGIGEAYVINLERRADRMERFKSANNHIKARTYLWKAVDGRTLELDSNLVHCFRNNDFGWKKAVMGCALSHLGLWEKLANDTLAKSYLIMEDDVVFSERWMISWLQAASSIPADADVIYLGGILPPNKGMFPTIVEPVNKFFARVAKNDLFGTPKRRYFHFCNYAYVLTVQGARKMCKLVKEKGIFTSGDHMIVNHGDDLLNIYFTTPLLATCFQENDPVYQKSEFNNFSRIDGFDSDLWNNNERFSKEEVMACITSDLQNGGAIRMEGEANPTLKMPEPATHVPATHVSAMPEPAMPEPAMQVSAMPVPATHVSAMPVPATHVPNINESGIALWNRFLRHIALKEDTHIDECLELMFAAWKTMSAEEFNKQFSWFRILEQLILMRNETIMNHTDTLRRLFNAFTDTYKPLLVKINEVLYPSNTSVQPGIPHFIHPEPVKQEIYHIPVLIPRFLEDQWIRSLFPKPIEWKPMHNLNNLTNSRNPVLIYQTMPNSNIDMPALFHGFINMLATTGKQITLLHLSDEFGHDNISFYSSPAVKQVIRNYWRPDLKQYGAKVLVIPLGYTNDRHNAHYQEAPVFAKRTYLWSFTGSLDRPGREQALAVLRKTGKFCEKSKAAWSSPPLLDAQGYNTLMRDTQFVPCFRGSAALESYRFYEALEHGAIPIYVANESHNTSDEYYELFGKHPFLGFPSWEKAAETLPILAMQPEVMEGHRQTVMTWWNEMKKSMRAKVAEITPLLNPFL